MTDAEIYTTSTSYQMDHFMGFQILHDEEFFHVDDIQGLYDQLYAISVGWAD